MSRRPNLQDVARLSGVSTATVSRVLNEPAVVREETRKRVEEAVAQLGYTPHFTARALASNRTDTVGAVIPTMENAIFARGLQALQEALAEAGVTLLVATSGYDPAREEEQIRTLIGRGVDGLALIGESRRPEVHELLERRGVPFVLMWTWRADAPWHCVGFDNRRAASDMARRVLAYGHRRIGMVAGITEGNDRAASRVAGVRTAVAEAGASLALSEAAYTIEAGQAAAQALLETNPDLTALICGNDVLAAGAMLALRAAGRAVPEEVSVVGFDDIDLAELLDPPLTTVHVPHRRMGEETARMLLAFRDPTATVRSVVFEAKVIERGSLGRAAR